MITHQMDMTDGFVPQAQFVEIIGTKRLLPMVFGVFIDVPVIVGGFLMMLVYRRKLTSILLRVPLPALATSLLVSIPLIILEEQIDCMPAWCGQVLIPPTLPFLFVEILALALIALRIHSKNPIRVSSLYSVLGVLWEVIFGGLVGAPLVIALIFAPYVWIGYAFISLLPLSILLAKRNQVAPGQSVTVGPQLTN